MVLEVYNYYWLKQKTIFNGISACVWSLAANIEALWMKFKELYDFGWSYSCKYL